MATVSHVRPTELRTRFARRLSQLYGAEVPAYTTLVDVTRQVNDRVLRRDPGGAERMGSIERVTEERHGAIRVGSPRELSEVARIFGALGMEPTGFYDLRDAAPQPIPVVSTAFRPVDREELAINPFRVFTSMLVPEDRRFFDADLEGRLKNFIDRRRLFRPELLGLADRATDQQGLSEDEAKRFLDLAAAAFALSRQPVDRAWYRELEAVSGVAADIGGVATTHINHLTPRVLDIDDLYRSMTERGIAMIDEIQGPPAWEGPDVLLRQTSFRALAEPRLFREPDGRITPGDLRVRFGEVEARGIALTPSGRARYERLVAETDARLVADPTADPIATGAQVWRDGFPLSEIELWREDLACFTYRIEDTTAVVAGDTGLEELVSAGAITLQPIVYEDFLPRSAAGIFESNLSDRGRIDLTQGGAARDREWLADVLDRTVHDPDELYRRESEESLATVAYHLAAAGRPVSRRHLL